MSAGTNFLNDISLQRRFAKPDNIIKNYFKILIKRGIMKQTNIGIYICKNADVESVQRAVPYTEQTVKSEKDAENPNLHYKIKTRTYYNLEYK